MIYLIFHEKLHKIVNGNGKTVCHILGYKTRSAGKLARVCQLLSFFYVGKLRWKAKPFFFLLVDLLVFEEEEGKEEKKGRC